MPTRNAGGTMASKVLGRKSLYAIGACVTIAYAPLFFVYEWINKRPRFAHRDSGFFSGALDRCDAGASA